MKHALRLTLSLLIALVLCTCSNQYRNDKNDIVEAFGYYYEECAPSWHPYGNTTEKENFLVFDNDKNNIFINMPDSLFSEGIMYHRTDDVYPSITQIDRIDKIILENGSAEIAVDEEYVSVLSNVLAFSDIDPANIINLDYGKEFFFINVYYKNYPAYQNECMLTLSDEGIPIIAFCETEKNTQIIGNDKALKINNKELAGYLEFLLI